MSIAEKLSELASDLPRVFEAGAAQEAARCAAKHFVACVVGDGTGTLSFKIPFEPDYLSITNFSPFSITKADQVVAIIRDFRCFGKLGAVMTYCRTDEGATAITLMPQTSAATRFLLNEDGCTVTNLGNSSTTNNPYVFGDGEEYVITAVKYTDKNDKEYISEYISALSDAGGSISVSKFKKESFFTEEEWQTLIATKPNWTFVLI